MFTIHYICWLCVILLNSCCSEKSVLVSVPYSFADVISTPSNFSVPSENFILLNDLIEWHDDDGVSSIPWSNSDDDGIWVIERYIDYD